MPQIPQSLRCDIEAPEEPSGQLGGERRVYSEVEGHKALRKARHQLQTGEVTLSEYAVLKQDLLSSPAFAPGKSYAKMLPYAADVSISTPENEQSKNGFLTIKEEEQYLNSLDDYIRGATSHPRSHARPQMAQRTPGDRMTDKEKDMQLRNPVSVYNWLRKNEPQVFLQDEDSRPSRTTGARASKRNATRDTIIKQEREMYDEDGIALDVPPNRGKRKRDDDGGYRPKGGNSRGAKRKRESKASIG
jgi:hypothetical protein